MNARAFAIPLAKIQFPSYNQLNLAQLWRSLQDVFIIFLRDISDVKSNINAGGEIVTFK